MSESKRIIIPHEDVRANAGSDRIIVQREVFGGPENKASTNGPPTEEIGAPAALGILPWSQMWVGDPLETVPQLQWPASIWTYAAMQNDSQIDGLLTGSILPIRRYRWYLDPNGCDPAAVSKLAEDMNILTEGEKDRPRGRIRKRFSWDKHMFHAFKALAFGFYYFELVGEVQDDGLWHITKLSPRPPLTIMDIDIDKYGELEAIRQNVTQPGVPVMPIPAERLAAYVWDQEGANYTGRSMLRSLYKNWLIKDRLVRVDAMKHERNGMGVPVAYGFPGASKEDLQALNATAQRLKSGDTSGAAVPNGADLKLQGVQGMLPDTIASLNYHDEAMARRFLMMFLQLGSTLHGSRALGSDFVDYFQLAQEGLANWMADLTNAEVIEAYWDWNYGESDTVPLLRYQRTDDPRLSFEDLNKMIERGVIRVDDELEEQIRDVMELPQFQGPQREDMQPAEIASTNQNLPEPGGGGEQQTSSGPTPGSGSQARRRTLRRTVAARGAAESSTPMPDRALRRAPYTQEVESKVNLAALDSIWKQATDTLFANWRQNVTQLQIEELTEAIKATNDVGKLSTLEPATSGENLLVDAMKDMFVQGATLAQQEMEDQGLKKLPIPNSTEDVASFEARAAAIDNVVTRMLGNMASSRAVAASGGSLTSDQVGEHVREYLTGLSHAMLKDRLSGAMTAALNAGRRAYMAEGPPAKYYASEIMDTNTCGLCVAVDGTEYQSLAETEQDYPGGGYVDCEGGDRCRGTIIAVYQEANTPEPEETIV